MRFERLALYLRLGRVSNLPTVWTNTLTGVVLAGGSLDAVRVPALLAAFSLLYIGGMFLNDGFDRDFDRRERPERPIPAGLITARTVFAMGYGMVLAGIVMIIAIGFENGWGPTVAAVTLAAAIIGYDAHHKRNPFGPWMMGLCRALIYITAAVVVAGELAFPVIAAATVLFCYVVGLTYIAKRKATPRMVGTLIAGISLLDGVLMLSRGAIATAGLTGIAFFLTLRWQRAVQGT
ncbi:MAG TPA: UbiA family prenyltransferase [Nitrospiraceae bacterium]|nr:UbiA family prenyltransferase [Nitrospiraceae bacterium]